MPTVLHRLQKWANENPKSIAQRYKMNFNKNADWTDITTLKFRNNVLYLALFLESKGLKKGDIGCLYSSNCPQWVTLELALTLFQGMSAGIYPNSIEKEIGYILNKTSASVIGVQDSKYLLKMGAIPDSVKVVITFDGDANIHPSGVPTPNGITYEKALQSGKALSGKPEAGLFDEYLKKIDVNAGAFIIFTSGTTGEPKGAILSHDNLAFTSDMTVRHWDLLNNGPHAVQSLNGPHAVQSLPTGNGSLFSFLPLCHIAEKLQNIGVGITARFSVTFCSRMENLVVELPQSKPSLLLCVPRVWEKLMEGIEGKINKTEGFKQTLAKWALKTGQAYAEKKYAGNWISPLLAIQYALANKLVIDKIKNAIGFSNVKKCASGAAALSAHVAKWYRGIGLEILEDFGQTESTGICCMTKPGIDAAGTVGVPVTGTEFKIAQDGEVLTRGRHVFIGYLKNEAATREVLDADGWLHTGDLAEINDRGLVRIKGRKKEIMKSSGGKMVAPLPIEDSIKSHGKISQVCMVGDGRKYFTALITLTESTLADMAKKKGVSTEMVLNDAVLLADIKLKIDEVNQALPSYEKIKYFSVLSRDFSVDEGEMTPTLKMKRSVIEKKFSNIIDSMYV